MLILLTLACTAPDNTDSGNTTAKLDTSVMTKCTGEDSLVDLPTDESIHEEAFEWWYWTGHLQDDAGDWYGFEQVMFALKTGSSSYQMAHHALTQPDSFDYNVEFSMLDETTNAESGSFDWSIADQSMSGGGGSDHLVGVLDHSTLELDLTDTKGAVNQHCNGYTEYDFGGYTYYYSRPRMDAAGTLTIDGEPKAVSGTAWFDHQWGELATATTLGWDWFAVQLDDNREIMLFVVRDSQADQLVGGTYIDEIGTSFEIPASEYNITPLGEWTSPESGCTYPMGWDIDVAGVSFHVKPVLEEQELVNRMNTYWEGSATVTGDVTGRAYIELTGYCN